MKRLLLLAPLLLFSLQAYAQEVVAGISLERLRHYESFVVREVDEQKIAGAVSLINRQGELVYSRAIGLSDVDEGTPMAEDQIFYIQSMTKPIISVALMLLFEQGHFRLDDPVSKYLPKFANWPVVKNPQDGRSGDTEPLKRDITIRHLLTHTSGMTHGTGRSRLDEEIREQINKGEFVTVQDRLEALMEFPLYGQPGDQWQYSYSPDVLAILIEQFSGMSTDAFLKARIFEPLDMHDTGYNLNDEQAQRVAKLYNLDEAGNLQLSTRQESAQGNTIWSGMNGLWSTAADYMKFSRMMMNAGELNGTRIISRKTVDLITENHIGDLMLAPPRPGQGFGLGFAVMTDRAASGALVSNGTFYWSGAYNTFFFIDPTEELVAIFMTQSWPFTRSYRQKVQKLVPQAIVD